MSMVAGKNLNNCSLLAQRIKSKCRPWSLYFVFCVIPFENFGRRIYFKFQHNGVPLIRSMRHSMQARS